MKPFFTAILALIALHILAAVGFVGWLYLDGRLDRARLASIVDTFSLTIEEQRRREAEAQVLAAEARQKAEDARRLEQVAEGPKTLQQRLAEEQEADEVALLRLERLKRETEDLRRQNEIFKQMLAEQQTGLDTAREQFEQTLAAAEAQQQDENFRQTVTMYEQLKPKQAKQIFEQLMQAGRTEEVVDYLAAMQSRKAGAILREFKAGEDVTRATQLLDALRSRGMDMGTTTG
jgi:hypothetical protein